MTNRLARQTSPYLLQHANNPVDWYPWGEEALARARQENKPIFLSIGYAACHWCHVMEHESFEDPETAAMMNRDFVNIKVDREERPDIDSIYMGAVMAMTGSGGWPMSVFLTPEGRPFYGGTYFPPERRYGMPSFKEVLYSVARTWKEGKGEVYRVADKLTGHLQESTRWGAGDSLKPETLERAAGELAQSFNVARGGWGQAPLFPQPMSIEFLLQQVARGSTELLPIVERALEAMQRGGLFDVVGGGFHRYSTDDRWLVPHFEKMLYDNAQLALAYLHAGLVTGRADFLETCTRTLDFLAREMLDEAGGFVSSLDADSEGEEGKFYTWTLDELREMLPAADLDRLASVYPLPAGGNFEGAIIFQRQQDWDALAGAAGLSAAALREQMAAIHAKLLAARSARVRPGTDDKVLTAWNGLALRAFAEAARYLNRADYLAIAQRNAGFLLSHLVVDGHLMRAWRGGQAGTPAFAEDHAALALGLLALYQSDPQPRWFAAARQQVEELLMVFHDPQGGFFNTRDAHGALILRPKDMQDNATPSGNALAALALLQLSELDLRPEWRLQAEQLLSGMQEVAVQYPAAFGMWLQGMDFAIGPVREIALLYPPGDASLPEYLRAAWRAYQPRSVLAAGEYPPAGDAPALLHDRPLLDGKLTAYVCQGFTCQLPVNAIEAFGKQVEK